MLVLAVALAVLASAVGADTWATGLTLGLGLWVAFPAVLWIGAIVHAKTPPAVALIHAGDWLVKLAALGTLYGAVG